MEDFTQLPAVGLDYAGAKATSAPASSLGPAEMLPPHIAAIIDAKARQATKTFTENSALAGAKDGKSVQQQVQEQLGVMEPWNQFEQAADPVQDIAKRNATGNPLPDQAGQVAPTAEEILLQSPQEWQALFGSQVPDTSGALAAYQQASANRPEMPDLGRPRVDQTQQFIASLGALFDPRNAGQIMDLPTQNAQTDYEYKVKDAMRRYQMNNQDYEAKVELAKAILQNAEKEAAQAITSNQTGYKEYAQDIRNKRTTMQTEKNMLAAIAGRADVAKTNRETRLEIINAQLIGRSKQQLMGIALQAADPLEREAAAIKLYDLDGTIVTPPKTTGAQKKIEQGADKVKIARDRAAALIESSKWKNRLTQEQINTLKEKGKYIKPEALSRIGQRLASIKNYDSMIGSRGVRDGMMADAMTLRKNGQGIGGLRAELYQAGTSIRALDKQIADARDAKDMETVAALQDERELNQQAYDDAKQILAGIYSQYNLPVPIKPGAIPGTTGNKDFDFILGLTGKGDGTVKPLPDAGGNNKPGGFDPNVRPNVPNPSRPGGKPKGGKLKLPPGWGFGS